MKKKVNQAVVLIALLLGALISSHYTESLLTPPLKQLKHILLYGKVDRFESTKESLLTRYPFLEEPVINPVHVAQQAFLDAENYLLKKYFPEQLPLAYQPGLTVNNDGVVRVADWFIGHYEDESIGGVEVIRLPYEFDYPSYQLTAPWYSGMAQGMAAVVLLAAYDLTKENKYLHFAEKIGLTLSLLIEDGGTLIKISKDSVWHEEYADQSKTKHPMVLNGNNYAVDGAFWLYQVLDTELWRHMLVMSLKGLEKNIELYDGFFWSKYGLMGNYANWGYHELHISQLDKIVGVYSSLVSFDMPNTLSVLNSFRDYQYLPLGFTERILLHRNNMLFGIFFLNFLFAALVFFLCRSVKIRWV